MSHKTLIVGLFFAFSLLLLGLSYVLMDPLRFGICESTYTFGDHVRCGDNKHEAYGKPLWVGSLALLVINALLLFLPNKYFSSWKRFAMVYIPIATLIVATSPLSQGGGFIFSATRSMIAALFGIAYVVISLLIFASTAISSKK